MSIELQLLKSLSNGYFHSGESLAHQLGVSRTTIWKAIKQLEGSYSVAVQSVRGRGYRLAQPIELLDAENILRQIPELTKSRLAGIEIMPVVDSTNRYLMAAASTGASSGQWLMAEQQSAGRGRQGRTWISPFGCNLYASLLWRFDMAAAGLSGLGIVVAVAVVRALSVYSEDLQIKWPNDILSQHKKLAGILLEMQGEANGPASVVIGIGINVKMPDSMGAQIDQAWTDLHRISGARVSRNELAARLIQETNQAIIEFEAQGLQQFVADWRARDMLFDQQVELNFGSQQVQGRACGIDESGALQVNINGEKKSFMAGEASLKKTLRMD